MGGSWDTQNVDYKPGKSKWLTKGNPEEMTHKSDSNCHEGVTQQLSDWEPTPGSKLLQAGATLDQYQDQCHFEHHEWQAESTATRSEAIVKVQGRKDASLDLAGDSLSDEKRCISDVFWR